LVNNFIGLSNCIHKNVAKHVFGMGGKPSSGIKPCKRFGLKIKLARLFQQITIETTAFPIHNLPFPTITVCPSGYDKFAFMQK
jgi:hypothetical protein